MLYSYSILLYKHSILYKRINNLEMREVMMAVPRLRKRRMHYAILVHSLKNGKTVNLGRNISPIMGKGNFLHNYGVKEVSVCQHH